MPNSFWQLVTVFLLFLFVVAITYVTLRVIGRIQKGQTSGSNLEVIESRAVANGKYLEIVRAGSRFFLIAVGKDEIHPVSELAESDLTLRTPDGGGAGSFASVLDRVKNRMKNEKTD